MIIAFEGPDGSGKSTQAKLFVERLFQEKISHIQITQPSSGPIGRMVRSCLQAGKAGPCPVALALLFAADRQEQQHTVVLPAHQAGAVVVSDRWVYSSFVYQSLEGCDDEWLKEINEGILLPDLLIYCRVARKDVGELVQRLRQRRGLEERYDDRGKLRQAIRLYEREMSVAEYLTSVLVVDAFEELSTISKQVWDRFQELREA
jgi:dTMP kinase